MKRTKYFKRLIATVCAVVLAAGVMTSCGEKADKKSETTTTTTTASQGENNDNSNNGVGEIVDEIKPEEVTEFCFSRESGFYDEDFTLMLYHPDENVKIYYTTDGSVPDETDTLYDGAGIALENRSSEKNDLANEKDISASGDYKPSKVKKANVIRAVAVLADGTKSEVIDGTFFVGIDREKEYGDVPVISLMTDKENLFDYETGIYVLGKTHDDWIAEDSSRQWLEGWQQIGNYSNKGREWERTVSVSYLASDGSVGFTQDMGIRIMGGASRNNTQKNLRLIAREDYGKKNVKYPVIPDNEKADGSGEVEKYKSFVLRAGGNDSDYAKFRDPILQNLVSDRSFETMQYTPVVAFINGEYWGMYTLVEDYNDNYIQNNYEGIDNENVVVIKRGEVEDGLEEDKQLFDDMYSYITSNDMSVAENYKTASEMLDMQSFIDYCAFNLYIYNEDSFFDCNNWSMWRVRDVIDSVEKADGKWRLMAYDTDFSTGIYSDGWNYGDNNISTALKKGEDGNYPAELFTSLLENEEFKKTFIRTACDLRNVNFYPITVEEDVEEIRPVYESLVPDTFKRFGPQWVADQWSVEEYYSGKIDQFLLFMKGRYDAYVGILGDAFGLGESCEVKITTGDASAGTVVLNDYTSLDLSEEFIGEYFGEYGIKITAVASDGKNFSHWEYEGCEISDANSPEVEITLTGDCSIKAVFE